MHFMTLRPLLSVTVLAALWATPALVRAQEISAAEEQRLEALARENAEVYRPKTTVTVGFRMLSSGANVHFGNLGVVPADVTVAPLSDGKVDRTYNNGYVLVDTPRATELDTNGVQTSIPGLGNRYQITATTDVTDANGNVTGTTTKLVSDNVSYTSGLTRFWGYSSPNQATSNGYIAMSAYSTTSDGQSLAKKQGASGGVELQFSQVLGRVSKRAEWGFTTGVALNDISSKTSGNVSATLHTLTDYYSLNGQPAPTTALDNPYQGGTYVDVVGTDGTTVIAPLGFETTTALSQLPNGALSANTSLVGGATVHGVYKLKGAYFMVKVGPSMRAQLTERLGINASVGVAGAYAGTRYSVSESIDIPDVGGTISTPATEQSSASKFLSGYYADFNVEWSANETTGLFGGLTAQKFGDYDQSVGGRIARVDLGSTVGVRGGVSIRF